MGLFWTCLFAEGFLNALPMHCSQKKNIYILNRYKPLTRTVKSVIRRFTFSTNITEEYRIICINFRQMIRFLLVCTR